MKESIIENTYKLNDSLFMSSKDYVTVTLAIFVLIGALHALRIIYQWPAMIAGWTVPLWASWAAVAVCLVMAGSALKLLSGKR